MRAAEFCQCRVVNLSDFKTLLGKFPEQHSFFVEMAGARRIELGAAKKAADKKMKSAAAAVPQSLPAVAECPQQLDIPAVVKAKPHKMRASECLMACPMFMNEDHGFVTELAMQLEPESCEAGRMVMREGEEGYKIYFISQGSVEVIVEGRDDPVSTLDPGSIFGEMTLFGLSRRAASVRAVENCSFFVTGHRVFFTLLQKYPSARRGFMTLAHERKRAIFSMERKEDDISGCPAYSSETRLNPIIDRAVSRASAVAEPAGCLGTGVSALCASSHLDSVVTRQSVWLSTSGVKSAISRSSRFYGSRQTNNDSVMSPTVIIDLRSKAPVSKSLPAKLPSLGLGPSAPPWHLWQPMLSAR